MPSQPSQVCKPCGHSQAMGQITLPVALYACLALLSLHKHVQADDRQGAMTRSEKIAAIRACLQDGTAHHVVEHPQEKDFDVDGVSRSLLLFGKPLDRKGPIVGGLLGSDGLVGGGALSKLAGAVDGGPNSFGIGPTFNPVTLKESEAQGLQKQYSVNYQRGPWNVQTGLQVGVMAQDLVDDTFFLPPPGTPTTPGVPPPVLQSPQDTFNSAVNEAYNLAFPNGFSQGFADGQNSPIMSTPDFNLPVLPPGNLQGYNEGIQLGWVQGIQEGYQQGFTQARQSILNATMLGNSAGTASQPFDQRFAQNSQWNLDQLLPRDFQRQAVLEPGGQEEEMFQTQSLNLGPTQDKPASESEPPKIQSFSGPPSQQNNLNEIVRVEAQYSPLDSPEQVVNGTSTKQATSRTDPQDTSLRMLKLAAIICGALMVSTLATGILSLKIARPRRTSRALHPFKQKYRHKAGNTLLQESQTLGSESAAHSRSIARVMRWQGVQDVNPETANSSLHNTTQSSLDIESSAYMTQPTMFDFTIFNPVAALSTCPQSPSQASEFGSEAGSKFQFYLPTSCKSTGAWKDAADLHMSMGSTGR